MPTNEAEVINIEAVEGGGDWFFGLVKTTLGFPPLPLRGFSVQRIILFATTPGISQFLIMSKHCEIMSNHLMKWGSVEWRVVIRENSCSL